MATKAPPCRIDRTCRTLPHALLRWTTSNVDRGDCPGALLGYGMVATSDFVSLLVLARRNAGSFGLDKFVLEYARRCTTLAACSGTTPTSKSETQRPHSRQRGTWKAPAPRCWCKQTA